MMDMYDYPNLAERTKSPEFFNEQFSPWEIIACLRHAIKAGEPIDQIKKALFYNKPPDDAILDPILSGGMQAESDSRMDQIEVDVIHSILGSFTESLELLELLEEAMTTGENIDRTDLLDETGDELWYLAIRMKHLGMTFERVATYNIEKLKKRFPEKFTTEAATVRDEGAERQALNPNQ